MRFVEVQLFCEDLAAQHHFYTRVLGLPQVFADESAFAVQAGYTRLGFRQKPGVAPYHFAFNIPAGQEEEARQWLARRTDLLSFQGQQVIDFSAWGAYAMYFRDPMGNIVELIARRPLGLAPKRPFGPAAMAGVSELGMAVHDIAPVFRRLRQHYGLSQFDGNMDTFCAVGDHEGLFIVVDQAQKEWFPAGVPAQSAPFSCTLQTAGRERYFGFAPS